MFCCDFESLTLKNYCPVRPTAQAISNSMRYYNEVIMLIRLILSPPAPTLSDNEWRNARRLIQGRDRLFLYKVLNYFLCVHISNQIDGPVWSICNMVG